MLNRGDIQTVTGKRGSEDSHFNFAFFQHIQKFKGISFVNLKGYIWKYLMKSGKAPVQSGRCGRGNQSQSYTSSGSGSEGGDFIFHGITIQGNAGFGQLYLAGTTDKQDGVQFFFQQMHLMGKRRLRNMKFSGGTGYGAFFHNGGKIG